MKDEEKKQDSAVIVWETAVRELPENVIPFPVQHAETETSFAVRPLRTQNGNISGTVVVRSSGFGHAFAGTGTTIQSRMAA